MFNTDLNIEINGSNTERRRLETARLRKPRINRQNMCLCLIILVAIICARNRERGTVASEHKGEHMCARRNWRQVTSIYIYIHIKAYRMYILCIINRRKCKHKCLHHSWKYVYGYNRRVSELCIERLTKYSLVGNLSRAQSKANLI